MPEQCGFHKGKLGLDKIYVLDNVVRKELNENKDTCVVLIDFEKCFESIDMDLLLYRLLENIKLIIKSINQNQ